jgi:hypothetical protein
MSKQEGRLFLLFSLGSQWRVASEIGDVGQLRQVLLAPSLLAPTLTETISEETSLRILGAAWEQ